MSICRKIPGRSGEHSTNPAENMPRAQLINRMGHGFALLLVLLLALATTACDLFPPATSAPPTALPTTASSVESDDATPVASPGPAGRAYSHYVNPDMGFAFDYPSGWALQESGDLVTIATEEGLLQADAGYTAEGAMIVVAVGPIEDNFAGSLEGALTRSVEDLTAPANAEIQSGPTRFNINGYEAGRVVVAGTDDGTGEDVVVYITLVRSGNMVALVTGTTLAANDLLFEPQFDAVASSIVLPAEVERGQRELPAATGELSYGQTITGTFAADELVVWAFQGQMGDVLNISAAPTTASLDLTVDVVDGTGSTILPTGEVDNSVGDEVIGGLVLPEDGEFRVVLGGFLGSAGTYELTVAEATAAFGDVSPGAVITGSLEAGGDDTFTFTASEGVTMTIVAAPGPDLDLVLAVKELSGEEIVKRDVGFEGEGELASFAPEVTGQYLLQLSEFSGTGNGPYTLSIVNAETALIHENGELNGEEEAIFPLSVADGQMVVAVVTPATDQDVALALVDSSEQPLLEVDTGFAGAAEILASAPLPAGEYQLRVTNASSTPGSFQIVASLSASGGASDLEAGQQSGDPVELLPGVAVDSMMEPATTDTFTFFARAGEENTIFVIPTGATDPVVDILNAAGTVILNVDSGFVQEPETLTFIAEQSGDYHLEVHNFIATEGPYVIGVLGPGGSYTSATGSIGNDTADRYDLSVAGGERWAVMLFPEEGFDAILEVLDQSGQPVATSDIGVASEPETILLQSPEGGAYTVRVRGFVNAGGNYRIIMVKL